MQWAQSAAAIALRLPAANTAARQATRCKFENIEDGLAPTDTAGQANRVRPELAAYGVLTAAFAATDRACRRQARKEMISTRDVIGALHDAALRKYSQTLKCSPSAA